MPKRVPARAVTFGSLFTGIGGLDLGLERAGMECRWQVEIDDYCRRVLAKHWPGVPKYGDIKEIQDGQLEAVDLICGGFPCQPVSVAGKQLGQDDERWLWPEFARIVRLVRPRYVLVENVPGLLVRGMGDVLGDLAALGYDAEWGVLSAADMGAPHLRKRVFILADSGRSEQGRRKQPKRGQDQRDANTSWHGPQGDVAHAERNGLEGIEQGRPEAGAVVGGHRGQVAHAERMRELQPQGSEPHERGRIGDGGVEDAAGAGRRPTRPADTGEANGGRSLCRPQRPGWWATEPNVGRVAHGIPARVDRLRALGNAVVPQCAEWIGRRIVEAA